MTSPADQGIEAARRDVWSESCINRESDGTTYWHTADGWMAAPTQTDDTPDLNCASYVVDSEEYMAPEDYAELTAWLTLNRAEEAREVRRTTRARQYINNFPHGDRSQWEAYWAEYARDIDALNRVGA